MVALYLSYTNAVGQHCNSGSDVIRVTDPMEATFLTLPHNQEQVL